MKIVKKEKEKRSEAIMYYKLANNTDFECFDRYFRNIKANEYDVMKPVMEHLKSVITILEENYTEEKSAGGFVAFFCENIDIENCYERQQILQQYHLSDADCEMRDFLCSYENESGNIVNWYCDLYVLTDYHVVLIYSCVTETLHK